MKTKQTRRENPYEAKGFSLIEVILVIAAVGFLIMIISNLPSSLQSITKSKHSSYARDIAQREIEQIRKQGFDNLTLGTSSFTDSDLSNLPQGTASLEVSVCPVEICPNSEQAKKARVTVSWQESGGSKKVELMTIIGKGGLGQ